MIWRRAVVAAALVACAGRAGAQTLTQEPRKPQTPVNETQRRSAAALEYDGTGQAEGPSLVLSGSESYDWVDIGSNNAAARSALLNSTGHTGASALFGFLHNTQHSSFLANTRGGLNYYPSGRETLTAASERIAASTQIGRRTRVAAGYMFNYTPYYTFGFFPPQSSLFNPVMEVAGPSESDLPSLDFAVDHSRTLRHDGSVQLTYDVSRRGSLGFVYGFSHSDVRDRTTSTRHEGGVQYSQSSPVGIGYHVGYFVSDRKDDLGDSKGQRLDVGVDFNRAISLSRTTTLSFNTGSALLDQREIDGTDDGRGPEVYLLGEASLRHTVSRSLATVLSYRRYFSYVDGYTDPFVQDAVTAGLGAALGRRGSMGINATYLRASLAAKGISGKDQYSFAGVAWAKRSLGRSLAVYGMYRYYEFSMQEALFRSYLPESLSRSGVQGGFVLSIPPAR